ncbi:hypothetical protein DOS84_02865 [Flavobacterium aquariorum]|uniref:VOC domain-containing protein n=1 Tax=Flavobacterium aquariorum TaxID=2217670 RepID=A0A2W7TYC7_9FLAO|nr:VOC family protein [Flavobacterium aquariorum]PZX94514.1 hypothetical protein DOS84_02865 [Flavobacterium aquariorum]
MENKIYNEDGLQSLSLYDIAFTVKNIEESIKWYRDVLGFELKNKSKFSIPAGSADIAMLQLGDLNLEILQVPNNKRIEEMFADVPMHLIPIGNKTVVFQVTDIKITTKQLEEKGVNFVWKEQYLAGDKMLCTMIKDIDGNKINIFQTDTLFEFPQIESILTPEEIVTEHLKLWGESDGEKRKKTIDKLYDQNATLIDPALKLTGKEKINDFISELQSKNIGYKFALEGKTVSHHNTIKFNWTYGPIDEPKKIMGTDIITIQNGLIKMIYVYVDGL